MGNPEIQATSDIRNRTRANTTKHTSNNYITMCNSIGPHHQMHTGLFLRKRIRSLCVILWHEIKEHNNHFTFQIQYKYQCSMWPSHEHKIDQFKITTLWRHIKKQRYKLITHIVCLYMTLYQVKPVVQNIITTSRDSEEQ